MRKIAFAIIGLISCAAYAAQDRAAEIPEIEIPTSSNFQKIDDVAQYGLADWTGAIGIARNIPRSEAIRIASENPEITYFFWTKGFQMVLGTPDGDFRVFRHGDAVFFNGQPSWGSANGLADGYVKIQN